VYYATRACKQAEIRSPSCRRGNLQCPRETAVCGFLIPREATSGVTGGDFFAVDVSHDRYRAPPKSLRSQRRTRKHVDTPVQVCTTAGGGPVFIENGQREITSAIHGITRRGKLVHQREGINLLDVVTPHAYHVIALSRARERERERERLVAAA